MIRKLSSLALVVMVSLLLTGYSCKHKALQTSAGVAASAKALQDTEIKFHNLHKITDDEHVLLQQQFKFFAQTDKTVRECIYLSGAQACVDIGIDAVNNLLVNPALVGIKNEESKTALMLAGQSLLSALNVLKGAL